METIVTLFGGSSQKTPRNVARAAERLGELLAREGWTLRTGGGGGRSVMGHATDGALAAGGHVEGVILRKFWLLRHPEIRRMRSEPDFGRRKAGEIAGAHAIVCMPGGFGTLDEFSDVVVLKQNGFLDVPVVLFNVDGFFDELLRWLRKRALRDRFLRRSDLRLFHVARTPEAVLRHLRRAIQRR